MIQQLRMYEIFDHNKVAFYARFRNHAMRIMQTRYGFKFLGMWETTHTGRTEFVYLLEWADEQTKNAAWNGLKLDDEWQSIKRETNAEHGDLVGVIEDRVLAVLD